MNLFTGEDFAFTTKTYVRKEFQVTCFRIS